MNLFFSAFVLPPVADGSLTYAFFHSDLMGQGIVVGLTLLSIVTWTLMMEKGIGLKRAYKGSRSFLEEFRRKKNVMSLRTRAEDDPSPVARVYESGFARLAQLNGRRPDRETGGQDYRSDDGGQHQSVPGAVRHGVGYHARVHRNGDGGQAGYPDSCSGRFGRSAYNRARSACCSSLAPWVQLDQSLH